MFDGRQGLVAILALCDSNQPNFLNAVVVARCTLEPAELLGVAKGLEWQAGRRPGPKNSPRPLDVDLLVFGNQVIDRPELTIPHPQMRHRKFVLSPLAEVAPTLPIPPDGLTASSLLEALEGDQIVEKSSWSRSPI